MQARRLDQTLIELLIDSVNENNSDVKFLLINEMMITASHHKSSRFNTCLATRMISQ